MVPTACTPAGRVARRSVFLLALAAAWSLLAASPAAAHGIGGDATDRSVLGFVSLGVEHMLVGWDHIAFIGGVVMLAGEWRRAAKLISIFVVGHSITLITATLAGWQVNASFVDVVIVLSLVFVGAYGLVGRPQHWSLFGGIVYLFGLVHGLGLATRFQALGVPEDGMLWKVIAFNVGIEIGQLIAIAAVVAVAAVASLLVSEAGELVMRQVAFAGLVALGMVASPLLAYQGFSAPTEAVEVFEEKLGDSGCTVADRTVTLPGVGGGHTEKVFYEPSEEAPMADLGHSLGDGYVVVLYPPDLPSGDVSDLRTYATDHGFRAILAAPNPEPSGTVQAITIEQTLSCEDLNVDALDQFSTSWLQSIGMQ